MDNHRHHIRCHEKISYKVISSTETFFYNLGKCIAKNPFPTIIICLVFVFACTMGMVRFYQEKHPLRLWVSPNSQFKKDSEWLLSTIHTAYRIETAIITCHDVLTPEVIRKVYEIDQRVRNVVSSMGYTYDDVCFKILGVDSNLGVLLNAPTKAKTSKPPISLTSQTNKLQNGSTITAENHINMDEVINDLADNGENKDGFDPSVHLDQHTYCNLVEKLGTMCYEQSILDLWENSERKIRKLTKQDIINKINSVKEDAILGSLKNYESLLGDVQRNTTGHIIAAGALRTTWMTLMNFTAVNIDEVANMAGTAEVGPPECMDWELSFLKIMEEVHQTLQEENNNLTLTYLSGRSYGDITAESIYEGMDLLCVGIVIMFFYVQFVVSKFNWVEARVVLGSCGLLSVGMALIADCGLCALFGLPMGPLHSSLPFLLMGLGVDDMFVIVACWDQLTAEERKQPLHERVGTMLKHAGVSITVTTATDVLAFIVGAGTTLPALRMYCIYVAVGVALTFIFAVTFFIACFTIDQKRLENSYNGIVPWIKHENYKPNKFSQAGTSQRVFETIYSKVILTWPGKMFVLFVTLVCLGFSIEGCLKLEQVMNIRWFIPDDTYLAKYLETSTLHYPNYGFDTSTYIGAVNYTHELQNIKEMVVRLENCTYIHSNTVFWLKPFRDYILKTNKIDVFKEVITDDQFNMFLSKFLFTPRGAKFQANFQFATPLRCGQPAPQVQMSSYDYFLKQFSGPHEHVPAMQRVMHISKSLNLTTGDRFSTAWSRVFAVWNIDIIVDDEALRNMLVTLVAVMVITSLLIANLQICFWVFVMIILSMVNVCGFLQRWDVSINFISCVALQLGIGLCVDYATHIGHRFLTISKDDKHGRALQTVITIGSAVLYGGCSSLISVTMMGFSNSYSFRVFFKIFILVITFGLFHGVVLLPVILSWVGPKPYDGHKNIPQKEDALDLQCTVET